MEKKNNTTTILIIVAIAAAAYLLTKGGKEAAEYGVANSGAGQAQGYANAMSTLAQSAANTTSQLVNDIKGIAQQKRDNDYRDFQANNSAITEMFRNSPIMNSYY